MRITNSMTSSRLLLNLNRSATNLNNLYNQMATGKKIMFASENPILASRTLRFRTSVAEAEQYRRNTVQAYSWMEMTEVAMNSSEDIMQRLRALAVQGASDGKTSEDRQIIAEEMGQIIDQLGEEMNASYAGRYLFSGYRTDEPPVFGEAQPDLSYTIDQYFKGEDIEVMTTYQRTEEGIVRNEDVNIIKLPYSGIDEKTFPPEITVRSLDPKHPDYSRDAYSPPPDDPDHAYFIPETGELVLSKNLADKIKKGETFKVHYKKEGFEAGDINPKVYFDCIDTDTKKYYSMANQDIEYEFGIGTKFNVNSLATNYYPATAFADLNNFVEQIQTMRLSTAEEVKVEHPEWTDDEIEEYLGTEEGNLRGIMQGRFESFIERLDKYKDNMSTEQANLGSRMNRVELVMGRLEDDVLSYQKLLTENEDADYAEVITEMSSVEAVYEAAMKVGARLSQLTLADYI